MKISKILGFCKKEKYIEHFIANNEQWLGDGNALYPIYNLPVLSRDNILALLDITSDEKREKFFFTEKSKNLINFDDTCSDEQMVEKTKISIGSSVAIRTAEGCVFFHKKYLEPMREYIDMLKFYERASLDGQEMDCYEKWAYIIGFNFYTRSKCQACRGIKTSCQRVPTIFG